MPPADAATDAASPDAPLALGVAHLSGYQNAAYAERFAAVVRRVRSLPALPKRLPLTRAVARALLRLMAYKDEYEVSRLYTDGRFAEALAQRFDGTPRLEFHMAPPLLARPRDGAPPGKFALGPWLLPARSAASRLT